MRLFWGWMLGLLAMPAAADCKLEKYAELPVTMADTRPFIAGSINGVPATFVADSGSFFSIVTRASAQRFKLRPGALAGVEVRGATGAADVLQARAKDFSLQGFGLAHGVDFLVAGNDFAGGTDGVIGQNIIGHADTEYDLANGVIRLFRANDCSGHMLAYWHADLAVAVVPIQVATPASPQLVGTAMVNGSKIGVMFDSGAMRSMLDFRAARRAGIKLDGPDVVPGGAWQGMNQRTVQTWITRFDSLDVGGELVRNARLRIADIDPPPGADMLLGADFFLSHRIYVAQSQHKVYFTYNGGRVFDLRATPAATPDATTPPGSEPAAASIGEPASEPATEPAPGTPTDAAGFRRRGAASAARQDFAGAMADFDRAVALAPEDADNYYARGLARRQAGDRAGAASDFDRALDIRADDVPVLVERGALRLAAKDAAGGRADLERALQLAQDDATLSLRVADIYGASGQIDESVSLLDHWIVANARDSRLSQALGARCWWRMWLSTELDQTLADCNAAIKANRSDLRALSGRGLLWLRLGNFDKSIADLHAALQLQPNFAPARYGLGVAEGKRGPSAAADRDIASAIAQRPSVVEEFKRAGLSP
jgi:tetratricopeptide (TPR) repeat protein